MKNNKGFTLLEIISVVTIIVMLAVIIVPIIDRNIKDAQDLATESQKNLIEEAAFIYTINNRSSLPELDANKVTSINVGDLLDAGLLEEKKLVTVSGDAIPRSNIVMIAIIEDSIKTFYDRRQEFDPIIVLHGPKKLTMTIKTGYEELGASLITVSPDTISELSPSYIESGVNNSTAGTYEVTYSYPAAETLTRTVVVTSTLIDVDNEKPVIVMNGTSPINITKGTAYTDAGAIATDNKDGTITTRIITSGSVNIHQKGTYYIKYNVTDVAGNKASTVIRTVIVN